MQGGPSGGNGVVHHAEAVGQVFLQAGYLHVGRLSFMVGCQVGCQISGETRRAPAFLDTTGALGYEKQVGHDPLVWMQTGSCTYFRVVGSLPDLSVVAAWKYGGAGGPPARRFLARRFLARKFLARKFIEELC